MKIKNERFLFLLLILFKSCFDSLDECPKLEPIKYNNNDCEIRFCTDEEFENKTCVISNETAKIQWLNNLIIYGREYDEIYNLGVSNNKNEIIFSSYFKNNIIENKNNFLFYILDNNNQSYYKLINTSEYYKYYEFDSIAIPVQIKNKSNTYILSCCMAYCHLINLFTNEILEINPFNLSFIFNVYSNINALFQLNDKNYFYGSIIKENDKYYLSITSLNFIYNEVSNSIEINFKKNNIKNETLIEQNIISCFQTENNLIECMLVKSNNLELFIFLFDDNLNFKQQIKLDDIYECAYIKSIHLQKEIGVYFYLYSYSNQEQPTLNLQNLIYDEIEKKYKLINILNTNIILDISYYYSNDDYFIDYYGFELFKISNERFIILSTIYINMFVIALCDLYGTNNNNLIIRYYKIPFLLYNIKFPSNPKGFILGNHIGFAMIDYSYASPLIIIFGRNSNMEPDKIINLNIVNDNLYYIIKINDYINNDKKIDNNLFGYEFFGLKIMKLTGISSGINYYLNSNNKKLIFENDTLNLNDGIKIDYSNAEIKANSEFYIELYEIFGEPEYNKYNRYADKIEIYGNEDQKNYFKSQIFKGTNLQIKYNFKCYLNCGTCEYAGLTLYNQKCLTCKNSEDFCYINTGKNNEKNCYYLKSLNYRFYNKNGSYICIPLKESCPDDFPFENKDTKECKQMITFDDLLKENHIINNTKSSIDKVIKIFHDIINNKTLNNSEDIIIKGNNLTFQITNPENQKNNTKNKLYNNISSIDLNECEEKLKKEYNIKGSLIILKIDIKRNDTVSTQVEYQVINPENGEILDLSKCNNIKINIYAPVNFNPNFTDLINQIKEQGYDIFDSSDSFYNDICSTYSSVNNTDVILKDRKNYFYNSNLTLCEENCEYKSFDTETSKVNCECETKSEVNTNIYETKFIPNILFKNFFSFENYTNYKVLKCYNLAFNSEKLKKNIGFYILLFITLCFIIIMTINSYTQNQKFEQMFNNVMHQNFLMEKKLTLKKETENKKDSNKKIKNEKPNKQIKNFEKKNNNRKNLPYINNNKKNEPPKKLSNNIETGLESSIENDINKKTQKDNFTKNELFNFDFVKSPKKNTEKRNKKGGKRFTVAVLNKSSIRKFDLSTSNQKDDDISINEKDFDKNENKIKKKKKKSKEELKRSKTYNQNKNNFKNKSKINSEDIRIFQVLKKIPKKERQKYFIGNELNTLDFKYAIKIDFRSFFQYYWSLLKQIHFIIFTFITKDDYNLFLLKLGLFLMSFAINITMNALFFSDESMHKLFVDYGKFDFLYNLPQTIYSALIVGFLSFLFQSLSLSEDTLLKFKNKGYYDDIFTIKNKEIKCLKIKSIIFFIIGTIILLFFWYYLSCFCAVYSNTQIPLIKDTFISFSLSLLYPFPLTFIPTIVRIPALRKKSTCFYKISRILTFVISLI